MSKYGKFNCPDCGVTVDKTSPNMKRCKPCAFKAHGQTGNGFAERICKKCGVTYKPTGSHQKVCTNCADEFRKESAENYRDGVRIKNGIVKKGTILMCPECGDDFEYVSGPQYRCPACQRSGEVRRIHEWLASDKDRLKKYSTKAKDNYSFGGNRTVALERDNHTCQHCGSKDDLHVHHIDGQGVTTPKEQRNNALENLITLCRTCHTKEHHRIRHSNCAPQT